MAVVTTIKHPMISGYVKGFVDKYEISKVKQRMNIIFLKSL